MSLANTKFSCFTVVSHEAKNTVVVAPNANIVPAAKVVTSVVSEQSNLRTLTAVPAVLPPRRYTNTVLEVKKLPPNLNNIATLNGYFERFGKIVNIQVRFGLLVWFWLVICFLEQFICSIVLSGENLRQSVIWGQACNLTKLLAQ